MFGYLHVIIDPYFHPHAIIFAVEIDTWSTSVCCASHVAAEIFVL
jgi:hypothetical protein